LLAGGGAIDGLKMRDSLFKEEMSVVNCEHQPVSGHI
jgi:hypothetical protein